MKLIWSPLALKRASKIVEYIAQDKPLAAQKWITALFDTVDRLKQFPHSGRIVPEINDPHIQEILFGRYRVIYRIKQQQISILTVRSSKRLLSRLEIQ